MKELSAALSATSYPGRGILLGVSECGKYGIIAYFIMGRSQNSRNRIFVVDGDDVRTKAYDESKMADEEKTIAVQVNGKLRSTVVVPADSDADALKAAALADRKIAGYAEGMEIVKTIVVPNKLINLILKPKK